MAASVGLTGDFQELRLAHRLVNNRRVEAARLTDFDQGIVHTTITHACPKRVAGYVWTHGHRRTDVRGAKDLIESLILYGQGVTLTTA